MPLLLTPAAFDRCPVEVARDLVGTSLTVSGVGGVIVETEAYAQDDPASHSYRGPTARNAAMFGPPGRLYVYRIYGLHLCLNVVCGPVGVGAAVLIRALRPTAGIQEMRRRRGTDQPTRLASGPGRLCQALGVTPLFNQMAVDTGLVRLMAPAARPALSQGPRIGITVGVDRPWRFGEAGSPFLSRPFDDLRGGKPTLGTWRTTKGSDAS
jgi:DNA-3-methyladenine glycosylase